MKGLTQMWRALRKALGRASLFTAAVLNMASPVLAQPGARDLPAPTPPPLIPAIGGTLPMLEPTAPIAQSQAAAPKQSGASLGAPTVGVTAPLTRVSGTTGDDDLKARIDRLEKQNQELVELLKSLQNRPAPVLAAPTAPVSTAINPGNALSKDDVQKLISEYIGAKDDEKAKIDMKAGAAPQQFVVGKNTALVGTWKNHQPWLESADGAYRIHIGGRFQPDWVFGAGADDAVISGKGGAGAFQEGFNFRRARLEVDGWLHEVIDFFVEYDFANQFSVGLPFTADLKSGAVRAAANSDANTFGVPAPTDLWAGINYMPVIGGLRIGNLKPPIGLDHLTSSRYLDFMERSSGFDTYYNRNNGFSPGFMIFNYTESQLMSWQFAATKPNNSLFGWTTGGGEWQYTGRLTGLPWYQDEGRRMIHVGIGGSFIDHLDQGFANLNTRWLLRQGGPNLQNSVGRVQAFGISQAIVNPEFFMNLGPLSIQAEYLSSFVNGVTAYNTQLSGANVAIPSRTFHSQTAYLQAMYFLTGESRPYGKTALHGSGAAPTRVVPYRNYFWVPGHDGNCNPFSAGAWQVGARYCFSDLNDGPIVGGIIHEATFGLNWFLNPNMKIQWNYDIGHRTIAGGTSDGYFWGFGMRMAFDF